MKRGFLNTEKARDELGQVTDARESDPPARTDKGKRRAESELRRRDASSDDPVWRNLSVLDPHRVPPSLNVNSRRPKGRFVFRHWPRDPDGRAIASTGIRGKEAGNGLKFWGATLYDFYFVRRTPDFQYLHTISTGSKLANIMRAFGELEHAESEIGWADREEDPREMPAWDPAEAIVEYERRVHAGSDENECTSPVASAPVLEDAVDVAMDTSEDSENQPRPRSVDATNGSGTEHLPLESPFHPSHYPSPWPLVPFESPYTPFTLQRAIPTHLLPKKLHVHDPWGLVRTDCDPDPSESCEGQESWASKIDRVRTYTLSLPATSEEATPEDELVDKVFIPSQETEGPTERPAIRAFLPKRPRKPSEVPEAHLYLSPKGRLGEGNHSIVHEAELELPRNVFCESTYCEACLEEQINIEVDRLKESGAWEQRMSEAADNYEGPGKYDATFPGMPSSSSIQLPPRYVGFFKRKIEHVPMYAMGMVSGTPSGEPPLKDAPEEHLSVVSKTKHYMEYEGPTVHVFPNVQWQDATRPETICKHRAEGYRRVPRTATFRVAAKLSLPGDGHLAREAKNYLQFPGHFFQHWNGYNVVPPLVDPTPVGALVPQFFGYYVPDALPNSDSNSDSDSDAMSTFTDCDSFHSPILLIEHCGTPIKISQLCVDDRQECAALLFRFHAAGWLHASVAERNILMQARRPTCGCGPSEDDDDDDDDDADRCDFPHGPHHRRYGFRLIDFGRSVERGKDKEKAAEEVGEARLLFRLL